MKMTSSMSPRVAVLCLLLALMGPARAEMCAADQRPGATVLVPYFEVDLDGGATTVFWVRNMDTAPRLVNVQLWSDQTVPVFGFNVYLPAYGTQRVNLRDVLVGGFLPATGVAVSPRGDFDASGAPANFPGCNAGTDPNDGPPVYLQLSANDRNVLRQRLTGKQDAHTGMCFGLDHGDNVARGFVTVDVVGQCSIGSASGEPGYFVSGGNGIALNDNVLLGGFELIDPTNNFAQGGAAPVLEADDNAFPPGERTFYGRDIAYSAEDGREPLPGTWSVEFADEGNDSAELIVWKATPRSPPFVCGTIAQWFPLGSNERTPFDSSGDTPPAQMFPPPITYFWGATQRFPVSLIDDTLNGPSPRTGSARLNLGTTFVTGLEPQSWVGVLHSGEGRFSELTWGRAMDSGCDAGRSFTADTSGPLAVNPNKPGYLFLDGLEGP